MKNIKTGMQPDETYKPRCCNPEHQPPSMMVIPEGMKYVHVCPSCGFTITLFPNNASLMIV